MAHQRYAPDHDACGVGFVTQLGGAPSHEIVERALLALLRLAHRGGVDADGRSGDGAGLLMAMPDAFMRKRAREEGIRLPGEFGVGMVFLPSGEEDSARQLIEDLARENGLRCPGWRVLPTDPTITGPRARATLPTIRQCFFDVARGTADLERSLFRLRKQVEKLESTVGRRSEQIRLLEDLATELQRQMAKLRASHLDKTNLAPSIVPHGASS